MKNIGSLIAMALLVIFIGAGIVGLVWLIAKNSSTAVSGGTAAPISASDHVIGNPQAAVTLIEYSDLQCPACAAYYPLIKQVTSTMGNAVYFAYRHFPLAQHANARLAAQATEAAALQGKFWEMHDYLFERQQTWADMKDPLDEFVKYAAAIGLDAEMFRADIASDAVKAKVQSDMNSGIAAGVNSTPSFYLNGKRIQNPTSLEAFRVLIEQAGK